MISCVQFVIRCGRSNLDVEDLDDIPDYDVQDVPSNVAMIIHARCDLEKCALFNRSINNQMQCHLIP